MLREKLKRRHSASSIILAKQCLRKYWYKYVMGYYPIDSTAQMSIGGLAHECKEIMANCIINKEEFNLDKTKKYYLQEFDKIKKIYPDFDFSPYDEKNEIFFKSLNTDVLKGYEVVGTEVEFNIEILGERFIGSIDLLLRSLETGKLKVVDYKTSKKIFSGKDALNSIQQSLYGLACFEMYGEIPSEYEYDFVFLGRTQISLKGRNDIIEFITEEIRTTFESMNECFDKESWYPTKQILCTWCSYSSQIGGDCWYKNTCEYEAFWNAEHRCLEKGRVFIKDDEWGM